MRHHCKHCGREIFNGFGVYFHPPYKYGAGVYCNPDGPINSTTAEPDERSLVLADALRRFHEYEAGGIVQ